MKIATWNVNSVKARKERLIDWLQRQRPDVVCLQELKVTDDAFPRDDVEALGYHATAHGQKTYNGVAILSRSQPEQVQVGLDDDEEDDEARFVSALVDGVRTISVYVPNGKAPDSDKFTYKLRWLERLVRHLEQHEDPKQPLALCGDLNIAPDERDVARPQEWQDSVLCVPEVRTWFGRLIRWGLTDVFRARHPDGGFYSWWDYRMLGFAKNNGLRIDHILATAPLSARCTDAVIDRAERKGNKPSDHAPVIATFSWP